MRLRFRYLGSESKISAKIGSAKKKKTALWETKVRNIVEASLNQNYLDSLAQKERTLSHSS